jgi:hypothetical protein
MKRSIALTFAIVAAVASSAALADDDDDHRGRAATDFALFDGTNPANTNAGAVCFVDRLRVRPWSFHVAVSSFGGTSFRLIYRDGDFVPYQVPSGTSFSLSQAAGNNRAGVAIRVDNANDAGPAGLAGAVSAQSLNGTKVICISCDEDSSGDAKCDRIVPN